MQLDRVAGLALSDDVVVEEMNALNSLRYLTEGLEQLAVLVARVEEQVAARLDPKRISGILSAGAGPAMEGLPIGLVACCFHWYAVSACNFVQLTGWLAYDRDPKRAKTYVEQVIPEVKLWRDKVGAHFALSDPRPLDRRNPDNLADLVASVMFPIGYHDDVFQTSLLTVRVGEDQSRDNMGWSLTRVHRLLKQRYW